MSSQKSAILGGISGLTQNGKHPRSPETLLSWDFPFESAVPGERGAHAGLGVKRLNLCLLVELWRATTSSRGSRITICCHCWGNRFFSWFSVIPKGILVLSLGSRWPLSNRTLQWHLVNSLLCRESEKRHSYEEKSSPPSSLLTLALGSWHLQNSHCDPDSCQAFPKQDLCNLPNDAAHQWF